MMKKMHGLVAQDKGIDREHTFFKVYLAMCRTNINFFVADGFRNLGGEFLYWMLLGVGSLGNFTANY